MSLDYPVNIENPELENSLASLFGKDWRSHTKLVQVLEMVIHGKNTPVERIFQIQSSGFDDTKRTLLANINGGITHGKFSYHPNLDDGDVLNIINTARKALKQDALPNRKTENPTNRKTVDILDLDQWALANQNPAQ